MSTGKWNGRLVSRARASFAPAVDSGDAVCYRCRGRIVPGQKWDVDHVIPQSTGIDAADPTNWAVSHRWCNQSHGGKLGARRQAAGVRAPREIPKVERPGLLFSESPDNPRPSPLPIPLSEGGEDR